MFGIGLVKKGWNGMVYVLLFELFRWYGFHSFSSNVSPFLPLDGTGTNLTLYLLLDHVSFHSPNIVLMFIHSLLLDHVSYLLWTLKITFLDKGETWKSTFFKNRWMSQIFSQDSRNLSWTDSKFKIWSNVMYNLQFLIQCVP